MFMNLKSPPSMVNPWILIIFPFSTIYQTRDQTIFPFHKPQIHQSFPNREKENTHFGPYVHSTHLELPLFFCAQPLSAGNFETFCICFAGSLSRVTALFSQVSLSKYNLKWKKKVVKVHHRKKHFKSTYTKYRTVHPWLEIAVTSVKSEGNSFTVLVSLPIHFTHKTCRCFFEIRDGSSTQAWCLETTHPWPKHLSLAGDAGHANSSWEPRIILWNSVHGLLNTWRIIPVSKWLSTIWLASPLQ